jgi:signal transduction histidine kinase
LGQTNLTTHNGNGITQIIKEKKEIYDSYLNLALTAKEEVLMAVISDYWIVSNPYFWSDIHPLATANNGNNNNHAGGARASKARFRLLIPILNKANEPFVSSALRGIDWRETESTGVTFAIYDRSKAILVEYTEPANSEKVYDAVASAILTSNKQTVLGLASIFDALWHKSELIENAQRSKRHAELLQDVITHDIRNFNQIASLSTELLAEKFKKDAEALQLFISLQNAISGSTELLSKAKRLGKVLAETKPALYEVNLIESINRSSAIVREAHAKKEIICVNDNSFLSPATSSTTLSHSALAEVKKEQHLHVFADDLLDEVFTNVISNSVKYTDSSQVHLEIKIEEVREHPKEALKMEPTLQLKDANTSGALHSLYWKVSISDRGTGIQDEMKGQVFARYLAQAKGSGLGMSIVHALVVERYKGKITLRNRVPDDYRKGTVVEIWLPKAD